MSENDGQRPDDEAADGAIHDEILEIMEALRDRYGDRDPSEEEVRDFLRERMIADGRTPEEAEEILRSL